MTDETVQPKQPATWRIILAFFLDFWTAFFAAGFLVATVAGGRRPKVLPSTARPPLSPSR
ncbi:hypothetical protein ABVB70_26045 [Agrobacterium radiobacter]|uniref:Uncharacterized protein n=1 Tax=Agrobacterium radiobacter TaxID=362 RepID=A0ABD5LT98_AGRRD